MDQYIMNIFGRVAQQEEKWESCRKSQGTVHFPSFTHNRIKPYAGQYREDNSISFIDLND